MMQRIIHNLIGLVFACVFFACNSEESIRPKNLLLYDFCKLNDEQSTEKWIYNGVEIDDAFTGDYVSQVSKENPIGITYESNFTSALNRRNLQLIYHGRIRTSDIKSCGEFVFKVVRNNSTLFEKHCDNKRFIKKEKEWTFFCDTVIITQNFSSDSVNKLNIIFQHTGGESVVEADDIHLKIFDIHNYSFLPKVPQALEKSKDNKTLFENNFYKIRYNETQQTLHISDKNGLNLTQQITYLFDYKKSRKDSICSLAFQQFKILKQEKNSLEFLAKNNLISVHLKIEIDTSAKLHFNATREYHAQIFTVREAVVFETNDNISEVYRSNRQSDTHNFQDEYWLDKEGVKFGENERSIYFYHNENISSVQVGTLKNQLIVNLDYSEDHPFIRFPLIENAKQEVIEGLSEKEHKAKSKATNDWTFFIGEEAHSLPRFMKNNNGFVSTYIFTEHADNTDLRTQYAVNYGSEEINSYNKAIGGFAKYNIPNTKSIFYNNQSKTTNAKANENFTSEICNLKGNPSFEKFIDELYANGQEICLHSPDHLTTTPQNLKEAIAYMAKKYLSKSWIDHGYDNSLENNREDFVCDGLVSSSPYYALDIWQKNKTQYFWNCQNEHSWIHTQYHHSNSLTDVYHGWGDRLPNPHYWLEENALNKAYSWSTNQHFAFSSVQQWKELYNERTLNDLMYNQRVCINHCYPSAVNKNSVYWKMDEQGKCVIQPEFDEALKLLANYRDHKLLNITT
ncbi:MAG: hypothetical protein ACO3EE_10740, partial [Flavobacteriales bacterium]